jgi:hypothetical protein
MKANPNPKPPTKGEMLATIERAIEKMERPFVVALTPQATRALMAAKNRAYLERAYRWSEYILFWQYGRMASDSIDDDYRELLNAIAEALGGQNG